MKFEASRGGHAPGHLRESFDACFSGHVSEPWYVPLGKEGMLLNATWEGLDLKQRARWLIGQLWNCSDILPRDCCEGLDVPIGSSYATGVRTLRSTVD